MSRLAVVRLAMVAALGLTLLLGGCSAGLNTQMTEQEVAVDGASGQIGPIAVRNARFPFPAGDDHYYPAGSDVSLLMTVANTGVTEDELVSVTSPAAESAEIEGQRRLPGQRTLRAVELDAAAKDAGLGQGELRIVLQNLSQDVKPGLTVRVTLLFRQAGQVDLDVPIGDPADAHA